MFVLSLPQAPHSIKSIDATLSLARHGLTTLRAKREVERLLDDGRAIVELPTVEDQRAVVLELGAAGIVARPVDNALIDIRALRSRLGLTREQFACRYGLDLETLRNWESGRREPDQAARSYLRAIANDPTRVEEAYAPTPE